MRVNGEDVTDKGVEFKAGEDVSGVEIELTNRTTAIGGSVTDDKGAALKDYTVVVFAEDPSKWALPLTRWTASSRPDQDGHFKFANLPPGAYHASRSNTSRRETGAIPSGWRAPRRRPPASPSTKGPPRRWI